MNIAQYSLILPIRIYRVAVSPALHALFGPGAGCRYTPSCSLYALEAVKMHGALKGGWLAFSRLCRCHPWGGCGEDPVPKTFRFQIPGIDFLNRKLLHRHLKV